MNWIETPESSNIVRFGYDATSRALRVQFKHGKTYRFAEVPEVVFERMKAAPSKGRFVNGAIKGAYLFEVE